MNTKKESLGATCATIGFHIEQQQTQQTKKKKMMMIFALWVENVHSTTHLEEKVFSLPLPPPPPLLPFSYYFSNLLKRRRASSTTWSLDCAEGKKNKKKEKYTRSTALVPSSSTDHPPTDRPTSAILFHLEKNLSVAPYSWAGRNKKDGKKSDIVLSFSQSLGAASNLYYTQGGRADGRTGEERLRS